METTQFNSAGKTFAIRQAPRSPLLAPSRAFTLVELLVVITIISILAALITVAAVGALKAMSRTRIKAEINEIANGVDEYKNKFTAYPPNCQTDGTGSNGPLIETEVLLNLRRHLKQMAGRSQETDDLARVLTGQPATSSTSDYPRPLAGGISAAEAVVFWLGGFSTDPKFPISGSPDGPSYDIPSLGATGNNALDPIETRKWVYPFDVTRLGPRNADGRFDESNSRFIEYRAPNGKFRRINFWQYTPAKSQQPFVYFDTSRHPVGTVASTGAPLIGKYDPPAATHANAGDLSSVYAFKKRLETATASNVAAPQIQWVNPDRFQVFHCGIDDAWDKDAFLRMAAGPTTSGKPNTPDTYLLFPDGPFVGEFSDTEVNFAQETTIVDSAK